MSRGGVSSIPSGSTSFPNSRNDLSTLHSSVAGSSRNDLPPPSLFIDDRLHTPKWDDAKLSISTNTRAPLNSSFDTSRHYSNSASSTPISHTNGVSTPSPSSSSNNVYVESGMTTNGNSFKNKEVHVTNDALANQNVNKKRNILCRKWPKCPHGDDCFFIHPSTTTTKPTTSLDEVSAAWDPDIGNFKEKGGVSKFEKLKEKKMKKMQGKELDDLNMRKDVKKKGNKKNLSPSASTEIVLDNSGDMSNLGVPTGYPVESPVYEIVVERHSDRFRMEKERERIERERIERIQRIEERQNVLSSKNANNTVKGAHATNDDGEWEVYDEIENPILNEIAEKNKEEELLLFQCLKDMKMEPISAYEPVTETTPNDDSFEGTAPPVTTFEVDHRRARNRSSPPATSLTSNSFAMLEADNNADDYNADDNNENDENNQSVEVNQQPVVVKKKVSFDNVDKYEPVKESPARISVKQQKSSDPKFTTSGKGHFNSGSDPIAGY